MLGMCCPYPLHCPTPAHQPAAAGCEALFGRRCESSERSHHCCAWFETTHASRTSGCSAPAGEPRGRYMLGLSPLPRGAVSFGGLFPRGPTDKGMKQPCTCALVCLKAGNAYTFIIGMKAFIGTLKAQENQVRTACCRHHRKWRNTSTNIKYSRCVIHILG